MLSAQHRDVVVFSSPSSSSDLVSGLSFMVVSETRQPGAYENNHLSFERMHNYAAVLSKYLGI
jgi:hypothetical protein